MFRIEDVPHVPHKIDGCKRNHHALLHDASLVKRSEEHPSTVPGEGG